MNCEYSTLCPEVVDSAQVFGSDEYVGHDEPTGRRCCSTRTNLAPETGCSTRSPCRPTRRRRIQRSPVRATTSSSTARFGSAWRYATRSPTQSRYRRALLAVTATSLTRRSHPSTPETAFLELQFYPRGWVPWPTWAVAVGADTCSPTKWCAAMNVFSLLEDPVAGTIQNPTCAAKVGIETFQFAFVTKSGVAQARANPLDSTLATFTPNPRDDLFMNSGDRLQVSIHDSADGVQAEINDLSNNKSGSMTASPANGFTQIQYDPTGTSCNAIPFAFHPMYSTASEQTRVIWAVTATTWRSPTRSVTSSSATARRSRRRNSG
jgi:hypothetical protein